MKNKVYIKERYEIFVNDCEIGTTNSFKEAKRVAELLEWAIKAEELGDYPIMFEIVDQLNKEGYHATW